MFETYQEMKKRQEEELERIPKKFAFTDEQFKQGMKELGLNENDTDKIRADLESGKDLPFAHLEPRSESLRIR